MRLDRAEDDAEFGRDLGVDHQRGAHADPVTESYRDGDDVGFDATTAPASAETQAQAETEAVDGGTAEATATASSAAATSGW